MIFKQYQTEKQRRPTPKDPRHRRNGFYKHTLGSRDHYTAARFTCTGSCLLVIRAFACATP